MSESWDATLRRLEAERVARPWQGPDPRVVNGRGPTAQIMKAEAMAEVEAVVSVEDLERFRRRQVAKAEAERHRAALVRKAEA